MGMMVKKRIFVQSPSLATSGSGSGPASCTCDLHIKGRRFREGAGISWTDVNQWSGPSEEHPKQGVETSLAIMAICLAAKGPLPEWGVDSTSDNRDRTSV